MPLLPPPAIRPYLTPFEWLYRGMIEARNSAYDYQYLATRCVENVKVISVGNLSVGGSGKTPVTEWLVKLIRAHGCRVAVVSRGYGRQTSGTMVVSDAQKVRLNVRQAGDEPLMLARRLPGVPVVVSENRYRGILEAKQKFEIQCAVLDDAFQHRKIHRDLDVVVMDVRQFSTWTSSRIGVPHLLPVGPLREPIKNLSRADTIILTHARPGGGHSFLQEQIQRVTRAPIIEASYRSSEMIFLNTGAKRPIQDLDQVPVVAFAGIAYPDSFFQSIEDRGAHLIGKFSFPDHHFFTENELNEIASHVHQTKAEFVITTEKDAMRLLDRTLPFPLYMIPVEVEIRSGTEMLVEMMQQKKIIDKTGVATGRNSKFKDTVK